LFKWGGRKDATASAPPIPTSSSPAESISTTKVLPRVISALASQPELVLMDLGPVVGANISFFGEQLACKIHVEDLFAELERQSRAGNREALVDTLPARLTRPSASVDGVLCWDLFDYLDKKAGQAVAVKLVDLVKPGGIIYGFFGQASGPLATYTRYVVESPTSFRLRSVPATPTSRTVHLNRDLGKMFAGMNVAESVLLKNSARETLFRKPS
jgi:hypothetical protein